MEEQTESPPKAADGKTAPQPSEAPSADCVAVKVAVRVRPVHAREKDLGVVRVLGETNQLILGKDKVYTFDYVFDSGCTQDGLFSSCMTPLLEGFFEGYNATVFCYGQTGAGKTHTLGGHCTQHSNPDDEGIMQRAIRAIFDKIESQKDTLIFKVHVAYVEIYLEEIIDLLQPRASFGVSETKSQRKSDLVTIREDKDGNTTLVGIQEVEVKSVQDVMRCLSSGTLGRRTAATMMNEHSSRSHTIFTIFVDQLPLNPNSANAEGCKRSKFHFVDLAGSERAKATGNEGSRFKESVNINSGLLALGKVVSALSDPARKKGGHVPYRESKLTRLLKDSLGGNCMTLMISCISPVHVEESINTLHYATRARAIQNKPVITLTPQDLLMDNMMKEIENLRGQLRSYPANQGPLTQDLELEEAIGVLVAHIAQTKEELRRVLRALESHMDADMKARILAIVEAEVPFQHVLDARGLSRGKIDGGVLEDEESGTRLTNKGEEEVSDGDEVVGEGNGSHEILRPVISPFGVTRTITPSLSYQSRNPGEGQLERERTWTAGTDGPALEESLFAPHEELQHAKDQLAKVTSELHMARQGFQSEKEALEEQITHLRALLSPERGYEVASRDQDNDERSQPPSFSTETRVVNFSQVVDEEKDVISAKQEQAVRASKVFNSKKGQYEDLVFSIKMKEELIRELIKSEKGTKEANLLYKAEIEKLAAEAALAQKELETLRSNPLYAQLRTPPVDSSHDDPASAEPANPPFLSSSSSSLNPSTTKNSSGKPRGSTSEKGEFGEYEKELKTAKDRVKTLTKRQKELEHLSLLQKTTHKKVAILESNVSKMKSEAQSLHEQLQDEERRNKELENELQEMKRKAHKDQKTLQSLQSRAEKQDSLLKRRNDEIIEAQRKLRAFGKSNSNPMLLEKEIENEVARRIALLQLNGDVREREKLQTQRSEYAQMRESLQVEKVHRSQLLSAGTFKLAQSIADIEQILSPNAMKKPENKLELETEKSKLQQKLDKIQQKLAAGEILSQSQEGQLLELDECISVFDALIDAKNLTISEKQREVKSRSEEVKKQIESMQIDTCRKALLQSFTRLVELRENEIKYHQTLADVQNEKQDLAAEIDTMRDTLQEAEVQADFRLTAIQKEYEQKIQFLLQQIQESKAVHHSPKLISTPGSTLSSDAKVEELQKELYFYKKSSRDLRKKLKEYESVSVGQDSLASFHASRSHNSVNDSQMTVTESRSYPLHSSHVDADSTFQADQSTLLMASADLRIRSGLSESLKASVVKEKQHKKHPHPPENAMEHGHRGQSTFRPGTTTSTPTNLEHGDAPNHLTDSENLNTDSILVTGNPNKTTSQRKRWTDQNNSSAASTQSLLRNVSRPPTTSSKKALLLENEDSVPVQQSVSLS